MPYDGQDLQSFKRYNWGYVCGIIQAFLDEECPLSDALTTGKEQVTIKFEPESGNSASGLFLIALVR